MQMNRLHAIKDKLTRGELVVGAVVTMSDPGISERFGMAGYDFAWIDGEHGGLTEREIMQQLMAASSGGAAGFVRIRNIDPALAKPVLDMGAEGIIFPMIRTVADAQAAVTACLYPPEGVRGFGPVRAAHYGLEGNEAYIERAHSSVWKILQVEHVDCVTNMEAILGVDGVDALMIGPYDLSGSIGLLGKTTHEQVWKLVEKTCRLARGSGIPVGAFTGEEPKTIRRFLDLGVSWIAVGTDNGFLMQAAQAALAAARTA
jgi:2-keto-3-deoxy-L-rhamnonate aldolase RhmA